MLTIPNLVAEVASNHTGDPNVARLYIDILAAAGVPFVKFQSWNANAIPDGHQLAWLKSRELSLESFAELVAYGQERGVEILTTVYDQETVPKLVEIGLNRVKIASTYTDKTGLLDSVFAHDWQVQVATGMSRPQDVQAVAERMREGDVLYHCVSIYPTPLQKANLKRVETLRDLVPQGVHVGLSNHGEGLLAMQVAAERLGVDWVETHVNHNPLVRKPHEVAPSDLSVLVHGWEPADRDPDLIWALLGNGDLEPRAGEEQTKELFDGVMGRG